MADINYPSFLPCIQQGGYTSQVSPAFLESEPAAGGFYQFQFTDDVWAEYAVTWVFTDGQASLFWQWFRERLNHGSLPFKMKLKVAGQMVEQECRFRRDGIPQLRSVSGKINTYSATIFTRSVTTPVDGQYHVLEWFAERSPNGNYLTGMSILDRAINTTAPEA